MDPQTKKVVDFAYKHYALIFSIIITFLFLIFRDTHGISFDALWYAAYIKAYPANFGEWNGGIANHFIHPRHIIYNPLVLVWWKLIGIFIKTSSYEAMMSLSSVFSGLSCYVLIKLVHGITKNKFISILSAVFFAFSYVISWHSTSGEVYVILAFVYSCCYFMLWKMRKNVITLKSIAVLSVFTAFAVFIHIQLVLISGVILLFIAFYVKDLKNKVIYSVIYMFLSYFLVFAVYILIALTWWKVKTTTEFINYVHDPAGKEVTLSMLISPAGLISSFSVNTRAILGEKQDIFFLGFAIFLANIYFLYVSVKQKNKFLIVCALYYFVLFFMVRLYEGRYANGAWLKFWSIVLAQIALNLGITLDYYYKKLSESSQAGFIFISIIISVVFFLYNFIVLTLPEADPKRVGLNIVMARQVDKVLPDVKELYIEGSDDVYNYYMFVFTKAKRVYTFPKSTPQPDAGSVYVLSHDSGFCEVSGYKNCQGLSGRIGRDNYLLYQVN